jgi:flagellar biosynthetic protein FlhB
MAYRSLQADVAGYQSISASNDAAEIGLFLGQAAVGIATSGAIALFALALLDFIYQRWSFSRSSRMSKQEVKEENKQSQGDPLLRSRMRQRQRALAAGHRQLQDVPDATVVVTNPTHFAVALKYEKTMRSPIVVAKGADAVAAQIRAIAREAGVPMVENRPLARSLYDSAEVGDEIPMELYRAVAEVLAYIFSLRRRRAR